MDGFVLLVLFLLFVCCFVLASQKGCCFVSLYLLLYYKAGKFPSLMNSAFAITFRFSTDFLCNENI